MPPLCTQILIVLSTDWTAPYGELCRYERATSTAPWEQQGAPIPVSLGQDGMAWGQQAISDWQCKGPEKREGDRKSPAGLFPLGPVFGHQDREWSVLRMPYFLIEADTEWIDDPQSLYYNQCIRTSSGILPDWTSSERMAAIGALYALGVVVRYNMDPIEPGKGSAIFLHLWAKDKGATAGCTAMDEPSLSQIVAWLDQEKHPHLLQMPRDAWISLTKFVKSTAPLKKLYLPFML